MRGAGDCLFATIRDAFKSININATVPILRNMISEQVDQILFFKTIKYSI